MKIFVNDYKIECMWEGPHTPVAESSTGEIKEVPATFNTFNNRFMDIRMWDKDFNLLSLQKSLAKGYFTLNDNEKIDAASNSIVMKSAFELQSVAELQTMLLPQCSATSTAAIYKAYPAYAQQNLTNDSNYSANVISAEMGKTSDAINAEMFPLVSTAVTVDDLKKVRDSISTLDLTPYVSAAPKKLQPGLLTAYRTVLRSIVVYKLIKCIRDWCNAKQAEITACTTAKQLEAVIFTDCPDIV